MKSKLGLTFFPAFDWMISPTHPERQERLLYTRDQLLEEGLFDLPQIREYRPRLAEINDLQRAHIGVPSIARLITPAHLTSAGGCLAAADAVMSGEVKRAFALVRPPGHHAMRVVHGIRGFCTVNIEAVMVEYLRSVYGIKKSLLSILTYIMVMVRRIFFIMILILYIFLFIRTAGPCIPVRVFLMKPAVRQPGVQISTCRCCRAQVMRDCTDYMMV